MVDRRGVRRLVSTRNCANFNILTYLDFVELFKINVVLTLNMLLTKLKTQMNKLGRLAEGSHASSSELRHRV